MLYKHASLSIEVVATIFSTDSVYTVLFVYTLGKSFGVLTYYTCPLLSQLGYCCALYALCMRSIKGLLCYSPCFFSTTHQSWTASWATIWMNFAIWPENPWFPRWLPRSRKASSVPRVCKREICINATGNQLKGRNMRTENRQLFSSYCEH